MDENDALITFCILHTSRLNCTKQCTNSIAKYTDVGHLIKVLRQGYTDKETETYFKEMEKRDNFEVLRLKENIGVSAGRKMLIDQANTPLIMTLDNDIYLTENWFKPIIEVLEKNEDIGVVGIPRYRFNGELDGIGGRKIKIINNVVYTEKPKLERNEQFILVDDVCGAILFRQEVKSDFAFDPQFFMEFSDLDKGLQLLASSWKKIVCLRSKVIHDHVGMRNLNYVAKRMNYAETSRAYAKFRKKWGLRLPRERHLMLKYIYPFILPPLYKTSHKLKNIIRRAHI
ncbi:MAG: glycosyltransferase [Candidatus Bathyarchaeota archaeon]|nr:glycosyltransferase [Candidatus Bathyarchaeota archaeon]MDH5733290.1 glycosyltransferase [Candidatus Bathyarchaeota archaeon]